MTFEVKDWKDANEDGTGDHSTPTDAAALKDLEARLAAYTDLFVRTDLWSVEQMADVLRRLVGPVSLNSSSTTVYTVPALTLVVVRDVHVCNETSTAATFTLSIGNDAAGKRLYKDLVVPANGAIERTGSVVLNAAEVLQASCGALGALTLTISGIQST